MRGRKTAQTNFLCTLNVEHRIPARHPIREVKRLVGEVFTRLDEHFEELYAAVGRDSIQYNETARTGAFYAESWALVHFLIFGPEGRAGGINRFIRLRGNAELT